MTQNNDKELLIKDLSARLKYGVKVHYSTVTLNDGIMEFADKVDELYSIDRDGYIRTIDEKYELEIEGVKPYLFPISSMTEEQKNEYNSWKHLIPVCRYEYGDVVEEDELWDSPASFQYLIENHFDYHGLIEKGLATDASNLNIY